MTPGDPTADGRLWVAIAAGRPDLARAALAAGASVEALDADGLTPLIQAVRQVDPVMVRLLLGHGADAARRVRLAPAGPDGLLRFEETLGRPLPDDERARFLAPPVTSAAAECDDPGVATLLLDHGAAEADLGRPLVRCLSGADRIPPAQVTRAMFDSGRSRRFGRANPEPALEPFWRDQIRSFASGFTAGRQPFLAGDALHQGPPVWSFDRFGQSVTRLPDGRWLLVAGEHEDHYDPDFCIYNDVTVLDGRGGVAHFLYPRAEFPPTDFHSATRLGNDMILIGNLGYPEDRRAGETQVLRLSLADFSVSRIRTSGDGPGWVHGHRAALEESRVVIAGGKVEPGYTDLAGRWALDPADWRWTRLEDED